LVSVQRLYLELALGSECAILAGFTIDQLKRPTSSGVFCALPYFMLSHAAVDIVGYACV
jgi:hypothetical protein